MIYNLRSTKNLYYPDSIEITWLAKLTHSCEYRGLGYNKEYHTFMGVDWTVKDVFFILMPNKYYSSTLIKTGW